ERAESRAKPSISADAPLGIVVAVEHGIMRDGINAILGRAAEFRVVGTAENGRETVQLVKRVRPDLLLIDINLPEVNGVVATQEILRFHGECKIVILSLDDDENLVLASILAGALAFIPLRASDVDLLKALRVVAAGGIYLSRQDFGPLLSR